jgi:ferredoxin
MKVTIDDGLCDGHGVCVDACPEVFELGDDDDVVTLLTDQPAEELRDSVNQAAATCPKAAITVEG